MSIDLLIRSAGLLVILVAGLLSFVVYSIWAQLRAAGTASRLGPRFFTGSLMTVCSLIYSGACLALGWYGARPVGVILIAVSIGPLAMFSSLPRERLGSLFGVTIRNCLYIFLAVYGMSSAVAGTAMLVRGRILP
jgi:hypothetical protein